MDSKPKNPICVIKWVDAAYTFEQNPEGIPLPIVTTGFIVEENESFVNISFSTDYNERDGKITPRDGYLIPKKSIIEFNKVGYLNHNE